jgi:hypothetical protein
MRKIFTLLFILSVFWVKAQNYTPLAGPYGGEFTDLISSGSTLIGAVRNQGILLSTDNGATWTESNTGITQFFINDLELDANSGKIYALTSSRLFSSSDNGATWITEVSSTIDGWRFKRTSSHYFVVSSAGRVFRSVNGTTWSQVYTLPSTYVTDFEVNASGNLFISTETQSVYRSTDNGLSFTQLDADQGLNDANIVSIDFNGTDLYALGINGPYKSANNGTSWTSIESSVIGIGEQFWGSKIESIGTSTYIFTYSQIYVTTNGGTSWSVVAHPLAGQTYFNYASCVLMTSASEFLLSITDHGTFRTTDSGTTWTERNFGVTGFDLYNPYQLLFVPTTNRILFNRPNANGFFVSVDDGASWDFLNTAPLNKRFDGFSRVGTTIYAYGQNGIVRSTDNAQTFTEIWNAQIGSCYVYPTVLANADANNFFSYYYYDCPSNTYNHYLLKSTNGAVTWTSTAITGLPAQATSYLNGNNFVHDGAGNIFMLLYNYTTGTYISELYKVNTTTNAGTKITNISGTSTIIDVEALNGKVYVTTQDGKIHITANSGTTWTTISPGISAGSLRVINDNTFYILNTSGAYLSTDGGASWVNTGTFGTNKAANDVVISSTNYAYVAVDNSVVHKSVATVVPPNPPTALSVVTSFPGSIGLKFTDNSNNEEYFIIERSEGNNTSYDSVATAFGGSNQNFVFRYVASLTQGTTYYFRVRAKGAAGKSAYTNEISAVVPTATCPTAPTIPNNRSWTVVTSTGNNAQVSITLSGNNTTGYFYFIDNMFKGTPSGNGFLGQVNVNCTAATLSNSSGLVIPNGVGSWDPATNKLTIPWRTGNSVLTPIIENSVYTLNAVDPIPASPSSVTGYVKTSSEIVVSWTGSLFAQSYQVQRATSPGGPFTNVGAAVLYPATTLLDNTSLTAGTTYYYQVTATNSGGTSAPSTAFSIAFSTPKFEANSLTGFDLSGQGVAWLDLENDGDEDLLLCPFNVTDGHIIAFENLGDGTFASTSVPGVTDLIAGTYRTISVGDINNDGLTDFIATASSAVGGQLFLNTGNKTFSNQQILPGNTFGLNWYASLAEINNDGRLDAVFTDDVIPIAPAVTPPASTTLKMFLQNSAGEFVPLEDGEIASLTNISRGGGWADIDKDGDMDFLRTSFGTTATDFDMLFLNQGGGVFNRPSPTAFETDFAMAPRTVSWGDYDNDLDLDAFVGHNLAGLNNMLYSNNGDGTFTRMTASVVAEAKTVTTFGSAWGDIDNDADLDLIVANSLQASVYLNDGAGNFTKYVGTEYLVASESSRTNVSFALADYDNNGTLDIASGRTVTAGFPTVLLKNNLAVGPNTKWLKVKLIGTVSNKSGIGATITITTPDTKKQMRQILAHTGYGGAGSLIAHFGLKSQSTATVEVRWPSGAIQTMTNIAANTLLTVTEDGSGPAILSRTPDVSSTNIAANTTVTITLNEASTAQSGKMLLLYLNSDLSTPITGIDVTAAVKSGNTYTFTLPSKLLAETKYNISVDAGAFKDVFGNASQEFPTGLWSFTVATAPVFTALSPANNAVTVAINTPLQITFDKTVSAVAGKKLKVMEGATTLVDVDVSTNGTITTSNYTFTPATPFPNDKVLKVTIDAGAFIDPTAQTEFAGISTEWTFTTILAPDIQPPVISFDNAQIPDPLEKNFPTMQFGIIVTDNRQVASASMWHRKTGEKTFVETTLTLNAGNGKWEGSLPNTFLSDMGFEYYFEAKDNATPTPLVGRFPTTADTYLKSKTSFKNSPPSIALPSAGTKNSWKIISIPYVFENGNNSAATLLSGLGVADKTKWRLLIYQSNPENWNENIAAIERGKGYFINTAISGASLSLAGAIAPPETRDNLFSMNLQAGWNQIGNPYTVAINLSDVKNFNAGLAAAQFVTYSNGSYSPATQLAPFEGGFVNVPANTTIKIPFAGQTVSGGRKQSEDLSQNIDDAEWLVRLKLSQASSSFDLGYIGMAEDASHEIDGYDMVRPPRFFDFIDMSVNHPEHVSKKFSGDVVPVSPAHTWDFNIDSNLQGVAEISWNNFAFENATRQLFMLDVARQVVVDMRKAGSYKFDPKESVNFRLFFGENLKLTAEKIVLGKAFPNPTSGVTSVGFSLPDNGGQDQFVTLDLVDPMGRSVGTIVQGRFTPGFNHTTFETNNLPGGFYTYRLTVQNSKGTNIVVNKLIIK